MIILRRTLYRENLLPEHIQIIGYARSDLSVEILRKNVDPYVDNKIDGKKYDKFWNEVNRYIRGGYDTDDDFIKLDSQLQEMEKSGSYTNRLYYMALPSTVYQKAIVPLKAHAMANK